MNYLKQRLQAFGFAFSGLYHAIESEKNLQLQTIIALLIISLGFCFSISASEWIIVGACITLVLALELVNSAVEKLCDLYSTERNPKIKYIKDVAAAAVLVASFFAAIAGILVFWPHIKMLIGS